MPIIGLQKKSKNPEFNQKVFLMFFPNFKAYLSKEENQEKYNYFLDLADKRISKSNFGTDWELAMSLCIAFYLGLVIEQENKGSQSLSRLAEGLGIQGRVNNYSVGSLSKSMDFDSVMLSDEDALFWNQNDYGRRLYALAKTKGTLTMMVAI